MTLKIIAAFPLLFVMTSALAQTPVCTAMDGSIYQPAMGLNCAGQRLNNARPPVYKAPAPGECVAMDGVRYRPHAGEDCAGQSLIHESDEENGSF